MSDERREILKMIQDQVITPEEGQRLLGALDAGGGASSKAPLAPRPPQPPSSAQARFVHISVASSGGERLEVNLPLKLGKFALKLIPEDTRDEIEDRGIDLEDLAACLNEELPDGPLLEYSSSDGSRIEISVA
ncbi:MAG: hypothetical protein HY335_10910 [Deinococcus sp.]|nr:hypothetical protein [Deinococcus sp.]